MAAKKNIYVIGYGIDPATKEPVIGKQCKTWDECKPYIQNVQNARYKGFYTQEEADAWTEKVKVDIFGKGGGKPPEQPPVATGYSPEGNTPEPERISPNMMTAIDRDFVYTCNTRGYDVFKVMDMLKLEFINRMKLQDQYLTKNAQLSGGVDPELPFN